MKRSDIIGISGLCLAFGTPLVICIGLLIQLVPKLSYDYRYVLTPILLTVMFFSAFGFYISMKNGNSKNE